jgi:hypothetical protein
MGGSKTLNTSGLQMLYGLTCEENFSFFYVYIVCPLGAVYFVVLVTQFTRGCLIYCYSYLVHEIFRSLLQFLKVCF